MSGSTSFVHRSLDDAALELLVGPSAGTSLPLIEVLGSEPLSPERVAELLAHAEQGGRVVIVAGPTTSARAWAAVEALAGSIELDEEISHPSSDDPLVADNRVTALAPGGRRLELDRLRPLHGCSSAGVRARLDDGRPVACEHSVGAGHVVVLGSPSALQARWLTAGDNADIVAGLLQGHDVTGVGARLGELTGHLTGPTEPAVVVAERGWLDPALGRSTPPDALVRTAGRLGRLLPEAVHDALVAFADESHPSGALLLRGMPIGDVPATPPSPTTPTTKDLTSELALLTVARRLGQPVGFLPEHGGMVFQNILPTSASLDRQVSTSSKVELMFHTEAAFHPHRPRFLLLLCLRGDPQARTTLAAIGDVLPVLPLRVRRVLFERRFRTAADESYVGSRPTQLGAPMAVLSGEWDHPTMVFDADLMVGTDREADEALGHLAAAVAEHHTGVVLEPGDLLVVDNAIAVHGRTPFRARFDGTDRWLQRSFVVGDLAPSAGERIGRVITTRFAH